MGLCGGLTLADGFTGGEVIVGFYAALLIIHGLVNFALVVVYQRRGGPLGALMLTLSFILTVAFYLFLALEGGLRSPEDYFWFASFFPLGTLAMISPLSIFYMPLAIMLRARTKALKGNGADETPKDQPN